MNERYAMSNFILRSDRFKILKLVLAFAIIAAVALSSVSCGDVSAGKIFCDFIVAVSNCDIEKANDLVSADTSLERYRFAIENSDEDALAVLKKIYSSFGASVISENVEADNADSDVILTETGKRTIRIKFVYIDLRSLMSVITSEVAISADMPINILSEYISSETTQKYISSKEIDVVLLKENGEWKLPLSRSVNVDIYDALMLNTFAAWLIG